LSAAKPIGSSARPACKNRLLSAQSLIRRHYFFTVNLAERRLGLLTENIGLLRTAFRHVRARHPLTIEAAVILPDHLHAIWTLPEHDADFALRWRLIKSAFSHGLPRGEALSTSRSTKGERGIWQRR
jgi:putative transposase